MKKVITEKTRKNVTFITAVIMTSLIIMGSNYAQYPSQVSPDRYKSYTEGLHNQLSGWKGWKRKQYYWSKKHMLKNSSRYVNESRLVHFAGHGQPHEYQASDGWLELDKGSCAWGRQGTLDNRTRYVIFQSCLVTKPTNNWRQHWKARNAGETYKKPFAGLHGVLGFKTNHTNVANYFGAGKRAGEWLSDEFVELLKDGYTVRRAWYKAAENTRSHFWWMDTDFYDKPSMLYIRVTIHEKINSTTHTYYPRFGDSKGRYVLDVYHMS
ncbi:MAG: hypothetical protein GY845_36890 [Planctomycetes bacterium]|nr:hypothetical protein [Planctomycetota bacterium]